MPLQRIDRQSLDRLAEDLGIELTDTEATIFEGRLNDQIDAMEQFLELKVAEKRLPFRAVARDPGHRPTPLEDPLNCFIRKCHVAGAAHGPLAGRTVGLKDHIAVAGVPMSFGSHFMDGFVPDFDATITTRLLDAGAVIIGKTNMEDFSFGGPGIGGVGDFGRPLNPRDHDYVTGGSSSGSAAAVAGGEVDIAFGGDQGGSVRIPAAWSGCVGLMPTHGLVPHTGIFGLEPTIDYAGPLTRTVDDMARVLQVVAGADGEDARQATVPASLPDYAGALERGVAGLRIGVLAEGFDLPGGDGAVDRTVRAALDTLAAAGAILERVSVPLHWTAPLAILPIYLEGGRMLWDTNLAGAFTKGFYPASVMATFGRAKRSHSHELPLNLKLILLAGTYARQRLNGRLYAKAQNVRRTVVAAYEDVFHKVDILAMPTAPVTAHRYVEPTGFADAIDRTLFGGEKGEDLGRLIANTAPFNYTGFPSISVPCGKIGAMPVGLQFVAPFFRDDLTLQAARAVEARIDWQAFTV